MDKRMETRDHNIGILRELGFERVGRSTIFFDGKVRILSPAVSRNTSGTYWFDIRKVNLDRLDISKLILVVRIVPDRFIVENIMNIYKLFSVNLMDNRPNSGNVWGLYIDMGSVDANLFNIKAPHDKINVALYDVYSVKDVIKNKLPDINIPREEILNTKERDSLGVINQDSKTNLGIYLFIIILIIISALYLIYKQNLF